MIFNDDIGAYCIDGVKYLCTSGTYNNLYSQTSPDNCLLCPAGRYSGIGASSCSKCKAGYYCEEGSSSSTQHECGSVDVYCPSASAQPTPVSEGYYSGPLTTSETTRSQQIICEAGSYCQNGIKDICTEGYYCEEGSSSATQHECGNINLYCPTGSAQPTTVSEGYYSGPLTVSETTRYVQILCQGGYYCLNGTRNVCEEGYYCEEGSISATQNECGSVSVYCPAGSSQPITVSEGYYSGPLSASETTRSVQILCEAGYYCINGVRNACQEGYYCEEGSSSATQHECGNVNVYCPSGSSQPITVSEGYYSGPLTTSETTRYEQIQCEAGYYCQNGSKFTCPSNTPLSPPGSLTSDACYSEPTPEPTSEPEIDFQYYCYGQYYSATGFNPCNLCYGYTIGDEHGNTQCVLCGENQYVYQNQCVDNLYCEEETIDGITWSQTLAGYKASSSCTSDTTVGYNSRLCQRIFDGEHYIAQWSQVNEFESSSCCILLPFLFIL